VTTRILAVASEAFPLAKTGGLGDAVSGMLQAMAAAGSCVTLMLPAYRGITRNVCGIRVAGRLASLPGGDATLLSCHCPALDVPMLLLQNSALFDRDGIYQDDGGRDYPDNAVRFAALAHAAARVAAGAVPQVAPPHIVHVHDWHAALAPLLLRQARVKNVKSVLTVHNLAFQGIFPMDAAESLGIGQPYRDSDGAEFWGNLSFLKAGIRFADRITVVSHNYASEILTPRFGCGLEGLLASRRDDLIAIPNGIDARMWDPRCDPHLGPRCFSATDLANKSLCKLALQRSFGLRENRGAALMAMGSRLTTQKMADLAACALPHALDAHPDLQVAVMGHGDRDLESALTAVARRYPGRCAVHIGFDEPRAHLLHAGADILLHGSRFEPFGLTPLYAMRYGTIPIGSKVGGMVDTIRDPGPTAALAPLRKPSGILFEGDTVDAMNAAIDRALSLRGQTDLWRIMQRNGMSADFSWNKAIPAYEHLYRSLAIPSDGMVLAGTTTADTVTAGERPAREARRKPARPRTSARRVNGRAQGPLPNAPAAV